MIRKYITWLQMLAQHILRFQFQTEVSYSEVQFSTINTFNKSVAHTDLNEFLVLNVILAGFMGFLTFYWILIIHSVVFKLYFI